MIYLKSSRDLTLMKTGGAILRKVVNDLLPDIKAGITTKEIDKQAEILIKKNGGEPSFNKVKGYHWTTCLSINDQIVHTPPSDRILEAGEILTLDIGVFYQGFHTDFAKTLVIGKSKSKKVERFLKTGEETLAKAINKFKFGKYIGDVSEAIEKGIYGAGYWVIKQLTGHGVGRELHEDPNILGFLDSPKEKTLRIESGLAVAIEVIYSMGTEKMAYENDGWSLVTADGSLAACFEKTVAIDNKKTLVLT